MENYSDITKENEIQEVAPESSELTRKEILGYIDDLTTELRQNHDTKSSIHQKRLVLAELLDALKLDYTTPAYYPELRKIQKLQKQVDRLADIVANKIGDKADKADIHAITDMRNMNIEEALYTATIILVRNGESAKDLDKLIHNT